MIFGKGKNPALARVCGPFGLWIAGPLERYAGAAGTVRRGRWNGTPGPLERYQARGFRGLLAFLAKCRRCAPWAFFSTCTRFTGQQGKPRLGRGGGATGAAATAAGRQPGGRGARPHAWEPPAGGGAERLGGVKPTPPGGRCCACCTSASGVGACVNELKS